MNPSSFHSVSAIVEKYKCMLIALLYPTNTFASTANYIEVVLAGNSSHSTMLLLDHAILLLAVPHPRYFCSSHLLLQLKHPIK